MVLKDDEVDAVLHGWECLQAGRVFTKPWPTHAFLNFDGEWCRIDQTNVKNMGSVSERDPLIWKAFRNGGFRVADTIETTQWRDHLRKWFTKEKGLGNVKRERESIVIEDTPPRLKKLPYRGNVDLEPLKRLMRMELLERTHATELRKQLVKCRTSVFEAHAEVLKEMDKLNAPDEVYQEAMEHAAYEITNPQIIQHVDEALAGAMAAYWGPDVRPWKQKELSE